MLTVEETNNIKQLIHSNDRSTIELGLMIDQETNGGLYTKHLETKYKKVLDCLRWALVDLLFTRELYISFKNLSGHLDLSGLTNLEWLDCDNNNLTSLDLSGLSNLERVDCDDNVKKIY